MKPINKLAVALFLIVASTAVAFASDTPPDGEWGNPSECVSPDTYTFEETVDTCILGIKAGTTCAYGCPHIPGTTYKYLR